MEEQEKKFYMSRTVWFNVLTAAVALAGLFGFADFQPSENAAETIAIVIAAANLVLRYITKRGIEI